MRDVSLSRILRYNTFNVWHTGLVPPTQVAATTINCGLHFGSVWIDWTQVDKCVLRQPASWSIYILIWFSLKFSRSLNILSSALHCVARIQNTTSNPVLKFPFSTSSGLRDFAAVLLCYAVTFVDVFWSMYAFFLNLYFFKYFYSLLCAFTHCAFFKVGETRYNNDVVVIRAVVWSSSLATARIPPPLLLLRWHFQYVCHLFILLILLYYSSCDSFSHLPFLSPTTTTYTNNLYCTATI